MQTRQVRRDVQFDAMMYLNPSHCDAIFRFIICTHTLQCQILKRYTLLESVHLYHHTANEITNTGGGLKEELLVSLPILQYLTIQSTSQVVSSFTASAGVILIMDSEPRDA